MPDMTTLAMVGAGCVALVVVVWALRAAAARRERTAEGEPTRRPAVVADTGAIREHLRDALTLLEAEELTVTVEIDGRPAVLASARGVVEAREGRWSRATVPVRAGGWPVARLEAARRPGERRFDAADMLMLRKVADSVGAAMQTADQAGSVPERSARA